VIKLQDHITKKAG